MFKTFREDIAACMARDPAARSKLEVILAYPGFHAVVWYRFARWFWRREFFLAGRVISHIGRMLTGIEIHPGAIIGKGFFIDHGFGTVIGETAEIGENVTLYQDVTLGGISPSENSASQRQQKRHPTLGNDVIVGSGAQILGPITVGDGARVGANSVALRDVPPGATVVGIPAKIAQGRAKDEDTAHLPFAAYGVQADIADPVQRVIDGLLDKVQGLSMQVEELERRLADDSKTDWDMAPSYDEPAEKGDGDGCTDRNN
jgi:serine O-acetyltransferase